MRVWKTGLLAAALGLPTLLSAGPIINGDFETGDFTGWSFFLTGTCPQQGASVTSFDTAHTGSPSLSGTFLNGNSSCIPESPGGGGILQSFAVQDGSLTITADLASFAGAGNSDAGQFALLLDGSVLQSYALGGGAGTIYRNFNVTTNIAAGTHELKFSFQRGFGAGIPQYIDNIVLSGTATQSPVPEPGSIALMIGGLVLLVRVVPGARRRQI